MTTENMNGELKKTLIRAFFFTAFVEAMIGPNILYLAMGHGKI